MFAHLARKTSIAIAAVAAMVACTIQFADLHLQVGTHPVPGPTMRTEVQFRAGTFLVYHGLVQDGERIEAYANGLRMTGEIVVNDLGERRLLGEITLTDTGKKAGDAPETKAIVVDQPIEKGRATWQATVQGWTSARSTSELRITREN